MYYQAVRDKSKLNWVIQGERGGVVPQELQGKYTKKQFAEDAIRAYEGKKDANVHTGADKRSARSNRTSSKKASGADRQETA